jgi:hypothetical protein
MREGNTDVRYAFSSMIDSVGELFGGRLLFNDLMNMDLPMMRSLVRARLENLENRNRKSRTSADFEKLIKEYIP